MNTHVPIYQKRGDSVVPLIIIDDTPSDAPSAAGHLVDSNGIASALATKVSMTGDEVVQGSKTFSSVPGLHASNSLGSALQVTAGSTSTLNPYYAANSLSVDQSTTVEISAVSFPDVSAGLVAVFTLFLTVQSPEAIIAWASNIHWTTGTPPDIDGTAALHLITFITKDGGATWYGTPSVIDAR